MDRNIYVSLELPFVRVALRKESVDRNRNTPNKLVNAHKSLSARRAWIEMSHIIVYVKKRGSLSARRAWIEMETTGSAGLPLIVALRKESVDRNV